MIRACIVRRSLLGAAVCVMLVDIFPEYRAMLAVATLVLALIGVYLGFWRGK